MRQRAVTQQACRQRLQCYPEVPRAQCSDEESELNSAPSLTAVAGKERSEGSNKEGPAIGLTELRPS